MERAFNQERRMNQQMKNDCQCGNTGGGCGKVRASGCSCGENCNCGQDCGCGRNCKCPAEKPAR
jgi:hypothetical protein